MSEWVGWQAGYGLEGVELIRDVTSERLPTPLLENSVTKSAVFERGAKEGWAPTFSPDNVHTYAIKHTLKALHFTETLSL